MRIWFRGVRVVVVTLPAEAPLIDLATVSICVFAWVWLVWFSVISVVTMLGIISSGVLVVMLLGTWSISVVVVFWVSVRVMKLRLLCVLPNVMNRLFGWTAWALTDRLLVV